MINLEKIREVPTNSGVYLWKNIDNKVIYVGKAKNLRNRMLQYFNRSLNLAKTKMVSEICDFEHIITNTEKEALTLEVNLIRRYNPRYNVLFMDDKRYPYIRIKLNKTLSISIVRQVRKDGALYYGPFTHGVRRILDLLLHLTSFKKGILYQDENDQEHWQKAFELCQEVLKPNNYKIKKNLEKQMLKAADEMKFEIANQLKKTIESLNFYDEKNDVVFENQEDLDVFGFYYKSDYLAIVIMCYRYGKLLSKIDLILPIENQELIFLTEAFVNNYYATNYLPKKCVIDKKFLQNLSLDLKVINPQKGKYQRALEMATKNAQIIMSSKLEKFIRKVERTSGAINKLGKLLKIKKPFHILMIDNSHWQNDLPISTIISYKNGVKQKNEYRKFNLEVVANRKADVEYLQQALKRYFAKNTSPDLLLVDGGVAQLHAAQEVIDSKMPIAALVKNDRHQFAYLLNSQGKRVVINDEFVKLFLTEIQTEVDRFARSSFIQRFAKRSLQSQLLEAKGISEKTVNKLLKHFKTYANIYNASLKNLKKVISPKMAEKIFQQFQKD